MADLIIRHINDEPRGTVITSEVMFDKNISGELPEHIDFIHRTIPTLESWGYEVKILHSDITYMDCFNKVNQGKKHIERKGMRYGFPMAGRCIINDRCKMKPIRDYLSSISGDYIQSVGIAIDEPKRLERMENDRRHSSFVIFIRTINIEKLQACPEWRLFFLFQDPFINFILGTSVWIQRL